ncbi:hypothetical protein [Haloplanus rubicundus]|uniref:PKD domain-containing protein n=1 Tax=Haloplanus rubicundus TaxID=1547898 RepID=A0A345EF86_9EURY|nr:hypothetical protein [Haloplanus rubicundus]AXG10858.1 hypothetical protein DU484_13950 [Haloplanus rubicundus]
MVRRRSFLGLLGTGAIGGWTGRVKGQLPSTGQKQAEQSAQQTDWLQQTKLTADDGSTEDLFGSAVALSNQTALIGAYGDDPNGEHSGSAYVFSRNTGEWDQQAKLIPDDGDSEDSFGDAVALSRETALIGAHYDEAPNGNTAGAGSAYVFSRNNGEWTQQAKLIPADSGSGDLFGTSVDIEEETVLIGAPGDGDGDNRTGSAYVFNRTDDDEWTQEAKLTANDSADEDFFGDPVAVAGEIALIGASRDNNSNGDSAGTAYVFSRDNGEWRQQAKLTPEDGDSSDVFGISAALAKETALIGARNDTSAYVFSRDDGEWSQQAKLTPDDYDSTSDFVPSLTLSGDTAIIGVPAPTESADTLSPYIFTQTNGEWSQQAKLTPDDGDSEDEFSGIVALDDGTAFVGAPGDSALGNHSGATYVFKNNSAENTPVSGFDPSVHGFGFANYDTGSTPDSDEVFTAVRTTFLPQLEDMGIATSAPGFVPALASALYLALDGGLTGGHCLGMVHTARKYSSSGVPSLPEYSTSVETAADIIDNPETTDGLDPVEVDIDEIQHSQAFDPIFGFRYFAQVFAPDVGSGSINHEDVLNAIENQVTKGTPASVSLVDSSVSSLVDRFLGGHQVLAYEVQRESDFLVSVPIYDPNYLAETYQQGGETQLVFSRSSKDEDFSVSYTGIDGDTYDRAMFLAEKPDPDLSLFSVGGNNEGFETILSQGLESFISVGVKSPVILNVTGPDGQLVPESPIPNDKIREETEYEGLYYFFDASAGDYDIIATGTDNGEYTVEIKGTTAEGGTINDSYTASIEEGKSQTLTATVPEDPTQEGAVTEGDSSPLPTEPGEPTFQDVLGVIQAYNADETYNGVEVSFRDVLEVISAYNAD